MLAGRRRSTRTAPPPSTRRTPSSSCTVTSHTLDVRAIDETGNIGPATRHSWTIIEAPANTLQGDGVTVDLGNVDVTFPQVITDGATTVSELTLAPAILPEGYFEAGSRYYDISTTAQYEAPVEVCISYNTLLIAEPVRLLHFDGSAWIDISTSSSAGPGLRPGRPPVAVRDRDGLGAGRAGDRHRHGPPASTVNTAPIFTFHSNDPLATFECNLDPNVNGSWTSCVSPYQVMDLLPGQHEMLIRAKNEAGLFDASPVRVLWTIGAVPDTAIISHPPEEAPDGTATFRFASTMQNVTYQCAIDEMVENLVFLPCTSPADLHRPDLRRARVRGARQATPPATSTSPRPSSAGRSRASRRR